MRERQTDSERESRDFQKFSNFIYISHNKKTICLIRRRRVRRRKDSDSALQKKEKSDVGRRRSSGKSSNKKSKGVDFNKGSGSKGTGKSTALTGKKAISAKARARKEAYLKSESALDPEEAAENQEEKEEQRALAEAKKKLLAGKEEVIIIFFVLTI